jgi:DNA-binding winged helix-turn-helix (wHTH) protein
MQIRFGVCRLDTDGRRLYRDRDQVHLTPKAFDLLVLLIENRHKALSKAELKEKIWPGIFVSEDGLSRLVNEIRTAIGDDARHPRWIRTVHGFGYAFAESESIPKPDIITPFLLRWASREFLLSEGENVIGRDPAADVTIDAPIVSRRHARIVIADGHARVEDLGSKNGTFVADQRVAEAVTLRDGDQIRVGDHTLVFHESSMLPTLTQEHASEGGRHRR